MIQILDGHHETVRVWLGVLTKYQAPGVGMKANVWANEGLGAGREVLGDKREEMRKVLEPMWQEAGKRKYKREIHKMYEDMMKVDVNTTSNGPLERGKDWSYEGMDFRG